MEPELTRYNSFGDYISNERRRRGLTLDLVAERTRINIRYLEAFERNAFEEFPEHPYSLGFIRSYAKFLGIDEDTAVIHFQYFYQQYIENRQRPIRRFVPIMGYRIPIVTLVLGFILFAALLAYFVNAFRLRREFPTAPGKHEYAADDPLIKPLMQQSPLPVSSKSIMTVTLKATGATWIQVKIDDYTEYSERIQAGDQRVWDVLNNVKIRTGNWEVIEVFKNGELLEKPQENLTLSIEPE